MQLTVSMIYDNLSESFSVKKQARLFHDYAIKSVFYLTEVKHRKDCLYIVDSETDICRLMPECSYLYLGTPDFAGIPESTNLMFISDSVNVKELWNHLQLCFRKFEEWKETVQDIMNTSQDLNELLNSSCIFKPDAWVLISKDYRYTAMSDTVGEIYPEFPSKGEYYPLEEANELNQSQIYLDTFNTSGPCVYEAVGNPNVSCYYYNILVNHQYSCRLLGYINKPEITQGALTFTGYLGKIISDFYNTEASEKSSLKQLHMLFLDLLYGIKHELISCQNILSRKKWSIEHSYQIICIDRIDPKEHGLSSQYLCKQIEKFFENTVISIVFENNMKIYCIRNITAEINPNDFHLKFPCFLRDNLLKAGMSNTFTNFSDLYLYSREAETALKIGQQVKPHFWYYFFGDFKYAYLKLQSHREFPIQEICHNALAILQLYDQQHDNSELYKTLEAFIKNNCNASHAADDLFIHRTTFLYRMNKISELVNIDFSDWKERSYLALSFDLMDDIEKL